MNTKRIIKKLVGRSPVIAAAFLLLTVSAAAKQQVDENDQTGIIERVGGTYMVTSVERSEEGGFVIEFKSLAPSGKFDVLTLESDHVHVGVKIGQKIRLSAEILAVNGSTAEVSQVVIFLPTRQGRMPVWLLSTKAKGPGLRATKYLEMHAPMTDFIIL